MKLSDLKPHVVSLDQEALAAQLWMLRPIDNLGFDVLVVLDAKHVPVKECDEGEAYILPDLPSGVIPISCSQTTNLDMMARTRHFGQARRECFRLVSP